MRLFWKIFTAVFFVFIIIFSLNSYLDYRNDIDYAKENLVEEHKIITNFMSKELEVGYLESKWPFESLKKVSKCDDFLFWWVVRDDGAIQLSDDVSFMGTKADEYFPKILDIIGKEGIVVNDKENYVIIVKEFSAGNKKWYFWLGFSLKEIQQIRKEIILSLIMSSIITLVLLGFSIFLIIKHFTKPVYDLEKATQEVKKGNLNYKTKITSKDELGELASAFNQMTADLKKSRVELEKYSKELEKKVKERTKELEDKNEELGKFNKLAIGRELKMVELKKKIKELENNLKMR